MTGRSTPEPADGSMNEAVTRSKQSLAALRQLQESQYWYLRQLSCYGDGTTVIVSGRLPSYFLKQIAQKLVIQTDGVEKVVDRIEVVGPDSWHHIQNVNTEPRD